MVIPERARWAVEQLAVRPSERLLEFGCGRGSAAWLVGARLKTGHLLAIDRSAVAIKAARGRNADHVAAGKVTFQTTALDAASLATQAFDKVYAINVNVFWVRSSTVEISVIREALKPRGSLYLFYEAPSPQRTLAIAERVSTVLGGHGWETVMLGPAASRSNTMVGVRARPR